MTHYELLGVPQTAGPEEITKAFRDKARLLHPDVNKSPTAHEDFKKLNEARATLLDFNKRAIYNATIPMPKPVPPKPTTTKVKRNLPRAKDGTVDYSKDPNLGGIINVPPRKTDLWGDPLDEPKEKFFDGMRYYDAGMPDLR